LTERTLRIFKKNLYLVQTDIMLRVLNVPINTRVMMVTRIKY